MGGERFDHYLFGRLESREMPLLPAEVEAIVREARLAQRRLEDVPVTRILEILDQVSRLWRDPAYPGRQAAVRHLPEVIGFSPAMIGEALDALADVMRRESLERTLRFELADLEKLDGWRYLPSYQGYLHSQALGVVLHVSAGNVFVGAADSLVHGLVTRNASLVKVSRADPLFPLLFARSLQEADPSGVLAGSVAILSFRGGEKGVEEALKSSVDGIVVWGGEEAVEAWRQDLPLRVRLVAYGPKYSFSVITAQAMASRPLDELARAAARDVVLWEQRACSSPQTIYVEELPRAPGAPAGDGEAGCCTVQHFAVALADALAEQARLLPPARLTLDEQIEILRHREIAKMGQAFGEARLLASVGSLDWTVICEREIDFRVSPLNRTVYVKGYARWERLLQEVDRQRGYVQTVGLAGVPAEVRSMATDLVRAGVDRITEVGRMGVGKPGSPHDGRWQLQNLVRQVCVETVHERFDLGNSLVAGRDAPRKWVHVQDTLNFARQHSPFYRKRLEGLRLESREDFDAVPLLDRHDIYACTPPQGDGLLTAPLGRAWVFASGGSTGEPKFSFYSYDEFNHVTTLLADMYEVAGVASGDVVANLFMAGNLWTSFIVANEALAKVGCVTLPIAGNAEIDLIMRYLQLFHPTALLGLPSIIIQIAETVQARGLDDIRVKTVLYGGEHLGRDARAFLRRTLGCETIISAGYASVDAGPVGYQCRQSEGTEHHLLYNYQFLEIIDPLTGHATPHGAVGEIVITNLQRTLMPIIRYHTGDLGRRLSDECPCGRVGPRFELLGRCDDVVRVGSVSVYAADIEKILGACPDVGHIFQLVAERCGVKDCLRILVESPMAADGSPVPELERQLERTVVEGNAELAEALREGWLETLRVEMLAPGGIPRVKRTGKVRRVVDHRTTPGAT